MTLIRRESTVRCDARGCGSGTDGRPAEVTIAHDLGYEADAGHAFGQALQATKWVGRWLPCLERYGHLCPRCAAELRRGELQEERTKAARDAKRRGHA